MVGDFLALVAAFACAYILRVSLGLTFGSSAIATPVSALTYVSIFASLAPFWILFFALLGLYSNSIYEKRFAEAGRLFMGSFVGMLFVIAFAYSSTKPIFPAKLIPVYGFILAFLFLLLFRTIARVVRSTLFVYNIGLTNVLIIGDTAITHELVGSLINSKDSGYRVVGIVGLKNARENFPRTKVYETLEEAVEKLGAGGIHSIVQTELYADADRNNQLLEFAQQNHIAFRFIPGNTELFVGNLQVELFRSSVPVIAVHQTPLIGWGRIVKRLFDIAVSLILIIIASPLLLFICLLQLFTGGQVFFRQTRLTRFNNEFKVFKFRTFSPAYNGLSPEAAFTKMNKPELIKKYRENGDRIPNDPRFGRFGSLLRKTSLDELPQLFNVLRGDLSLVGPRALVPEELSVYEKRHAILSVKSGLTGLAQVSGRRGISFDERRKLDMYYVQNWSFWSDIVILLKTIRVVLSGNGAS